MGKRLVFLAVLLAVSLCLLWTSAGWAATYYVDSVAGNDSNSGTSEGAPWKTLTKVSSVAFQPGDQILLKRGSVWNSQRLWPKGSGSAGNPIVVDAYSTGNKPLINTAGAFQEAVHLYNQQYWHIKNLEVTNWSAAGPGIRQGVHILNENAGTLNHIHLINLDIHNVNGHMTEGRDRGKGNGGILVDVLGETTQSKFNDVLIEGCYIYDLSRTAIKFFTAWGSWCINPTPVLHTNVVMRNNVVENYAGDGICAHWVEGALVEHNVSINGCTNLDIVNAAIWTFDSKNSVLQYNEVYGNVTTKDGQAYDIDGCCSGNIFQYNYSHNNAGGFLMVVGTPDCAAKNHDWVRLPFNHDNIVRYNISQRDRTRVMQFAGKIWDNYVYNNTIYVGSTNPKIVDSLACGDIGPRKQSPDGTYFYNNIIYNTESSSASYTFVGKNYVWSHNVFYGYHPSSEPSDPYKITADPLLVNPGSGGIGRHTVDGYKLQAGSPARDSGMVIPNHGGQDYWGNPVPSGSGPDRGAHEYTDAAPQPPVASFSGNPTSGYAPLTVNFTDLSTNNPTSWAWTFGDEGTSEAQHPSHEYTTTGQYTVSLTATNAHGYDTHTKTNYITVSEAPDTSCHVGSIALVGKRKTNGPQSGRGYYAEATITVHDQNCAPLSGVTVNVTWSGCVSGTSSGTTNTSGQVLLTSPVNQQGGTFTCTVTNLTKTGYPYNSGANHETSKSIQNP